MKTRLTTNTFEILIAEIKVDCDDPSLLEVSFEAELSRDYLMSTEAAIENPVDFDVLFDTGEESVMFDFNVAHRHSSSLHYAVKGEHCGYLHNEYDDAVHAFGSPIIDFIEETCRLLGTPFYRPSFLSTISN